MLLVAVLIAILNLKIVVSFNLKNKKDKYILHVRICRYY